MIFYIHQKTMDLCKSAGYNMDGFEVMKQLPRIPDYRFTVRTDIEVKRQRGKTAQWKVERHGYR